MVRYNYLLSIIIPTKNRYECLIPVIRALIKNIDYTDVEFVIQDNSDDNAIITDYLYNHHDDRVKYFYNTYKMSIVDNTICAINNASGKYLIFIGDDDLVSPHICKFIQYIDQKGINCLVYNAAYYWWNSIQFKKENYFHRKEALWLPSGQSLVFEKRNSSIELDLMLQSGAGIFQRLPKFYHGIVKRDILEEIKFKTGTYLPGSSPDIAFSTALSIVLDEFYFVNFPLTVFGASKNSGGGWTASNRHYGKIEEQKHLPKNIMDSWNPLIPRIWSEKTIYAQTVTEVLRIFKSNKQFNYIAFYGTMLAYEPFLVKLLIPAVKSFCGFNYLNYFMIGYVFIKKKLGIFYRKLKFFCRLYDYDVIIAKDVNIVMEKLKDSKICLKILDTKF